MAEQSDSNTPQPMLNMVVRWLADREVRIRELDTKVSAIRRTRGTSHDCISFDIDSATHFGSVIVWVSGLADFDRIAVNSEPGAQSSLIHHAFQAEAEVGQALDAFMERLAYG